MFGIGCLPVPVGSLRLPCPPCDIFFTGACSVAKYEHTGVMKDECIRYRIGSAWDLFVIWDLSAGRVLSVSRRISNRGVVIFVAFYCENS